ncbi:hypothetical protein K432DRAFT_78149 [Lepidopterella palustris CBS 459.81]|uniref:Uncharacterized protein n=1 Tax=Lepidopterella palustris CBS 459.81 TaxID=1314670 RepID=A0A8E2JEI1_9PEZI|nr:hypothetical protein K432DRAFT_78149 [Lepidopterella palustris CBS 459.81]
MSHASCLIETFFSFFYLLFCDQRGRFFWHMTCVFFVYVWCFFFFCTRVLNLCTVIFLYWRQFSLDSGWICFRGVKLGELTRAGIPLTQIEFVGICSSSLISCS